MKHVVIVAHPEPDSFTLTMARTYCAAVEWGGGEAILRDLYRMGFDPCLKAGELPGPGFGPAPDVVAEREKIREAQVFAFFYPLWFNAPPAMLKGYLDRVFSMGFGFGHQVGGQNEPLLCGRRMISFTSSGAPEQWVQDSGAWSAIRTLFDNHLAQMCGMGVLDHVHFGGITQSLPADAVTDCEDRVRQVIAERF
jgi:NAD(P)H dehydrogenase (quinone)